MAADARPLALRRPRALTARGKIALAIAGAGVLSFAALGLGPATLVPQAGGMEIARRFFAAALTPDLSAYTLSETGAAAWRTVLFAAAGMSLALVFGLGLGFFASSAWWSDDPAGASGAAGRVLRRTLLPTVWGATRALIAFLRSIHELLWAVLFAAALGTYPLVAVLAIAIPYSGTLAKVFSEMVDEAPRDTAYALRGAGATPLQTFAFGLLPRALPDLGAYSLYRFECALRSSAVLGFFGYMTLGYHLRPAFLVGDYERVWTYLYAIFALVIAVDLWSGRLRRTVRA